MFAGLLTTMRPLEESDVDFLTRLNTDPVVRSNVGGWDWPRSYSEQAAWLRGANTESTRRWIVEDPDHVPIGLTGLWDIDWRNRSALSGIKLGGQANVRGKGYGEDAVKALMAFAFYDVGLERLHSTIAAGNAVSLKVYCEKCGWVREGTARRALWQAGAWTDLHYVSALRQDFDLLQDSTAYVERLTSSDSISRGPG